MVIPGPGAAGLAAAAHGTPAILAAAVGGAPAIGRAAAQRLARAELAKPVYHPRQPLTERILGAVLRWLDRLFRAASTVPGGWWAVVALAALAVIVAAGIIAWTGPVARARRAAVPLAAGAQARTAADYRQEARRLADAGEYAGAIRACVRAIAAELDERAVLPPRSGRTADELAAEAGQVMPGHAAALRRAAVTFDEVCYGQRGGSAAGYREVSDLDTRIRASAPRPGRAAAPEPVTAGGTRS